VTSRTQVAWPRNLFLTGFSASGKSTVGPVVAARLGWAFVDLDAEIERRAGRAIPALFNEGEEIFRALEGETLTALAAGERRVIATGGGAPVRAENRAVLRRGGLVVCLEAAPETIVARLTAPGYPLGRANPAEQRPLLDGHEPLERVRYLKQTRQVFYADCDWTVHTDRLSAEECAEEVVRAWERLADRPAAPALGRVVVPAITAERDAPYSARNGAAAVVRAPGGSYPIFIGRQNLPELGRRVRNAGINGRVFVISDETVFGHHGPAVLDALRAADLDVVAYCLPPGEPSKSLAAAEAVFGWLVAQRAERRHAILALGGGVVGDLAGFVAATYLRGLPLVQVPTTLLAMVDSAIGGKVAVNLPAGKNLLGAFYQPRLVFGDVALLGSLTPRERASGWAEVIKHALILDAPQFADLERETRRGVSDLAGPDGARRIARSAAIKARVVSEDEREEGLRMLLNYGHTAGHALEAATNYTRFLHGEAVSIGMEVAARLAVRLGLLSETASARQRALLSALGLPTRCDGVDVEAVWAAIALDKKVKDRTVRWVLLEDIGRAAVRADVPTVEARAAFDEVIRP
jgi:3-dehydroquinate synthase